MAIVRQCIGVGDAVQWPRARVDAMKMSSRNFLNITKSIVFVGMMGAGKSAIGRRVAERLKLGFVDADDAIEHAAGRSISEIFVLHGEQEFRDGERRVIRRLLDSQIKVIATGGGAFMNKETRQTIQQYAHSIWLRADFETLWRRVSRRNNRPMLKTANPQETLRQLIADRYPIYEEADLTVESTDGPHDVTVDRVLDALAIYFNRP